MLTAAIPTLFVHAYAWVVLALPSPTAQPVYDTQADGFAASIVPAFVILGVLIAAAVWTSKRPRNKQHRR